MPWNCTCGIIAYNVVKQCPLCKTFKTTKDDGAFDDFDTWKADVEFSHYEIFFTLTLIYRLKHDSSNILDNPMTPEEELFAKFFHHEKALVKDMDDLTLRAHREELSKIAKEARARIYANDDEIKERVKKIKGFKASISSDDATSDAINSIEKRRNKISKEQKLLDSMAKLGISTKDAQAMLSAGNIKAHVEQRKRDKTPIPTIEIKPSEPKSVFNPFKKSE